MLGDVEETIYVVDEDDREEEDLKVCLVVVRWRLLLSWARLTLRWKDRQQEIRDAVCER